MATMHFKFRPKKFVLVFPALFLLILTLCLNLLSTASNQVVRGNFDYQFIVDEDGFTKVRITYISDVESGFSWVFVPKSSRWVNYTVNGEVYGWSLEDPEKYVGQQYYFYEVLSFAFTSRESQFKMIIEFNFSTAAIIIEPDGVFYSPQIGFAKGSDFRASVIFPSSFKINSAEALAIGTNSYSPKYLNSNFVEFEGLPITENLLRIQIGFRIPGKNADIIHINSGVFKFETVRRYEMHARKILELYNATYEILVDIFNITFESEEANEKLTIKFFIPDFSSLTSIGGYVPFLGQKMGDIYINFMFTRYIEGYLEVVALHELIHHFLWRAGFSPQKLLWFHEGIAQYISIEIARRLNYTGAEIIRNDLENKIQDLEKVFNGDFGFLAYWSPNIRPQSIDILYAAAYYIVSRLASSYGGINYYARVFKLTKGREVESNIMLCYYLSMAAGESLAVKFRQWGFNVLDLYTYSPFLAQVEKAVGNVNPIFQPFKYLAETIYRLAMKSGEFNVKYTLLFLTIAFLTAIFAPILTLMTYAGVLFTLIILFLKKKHIL